MGSAPRGALWERWESCVPREYPFGALSLREARVGRGGQEPAGSCPKGSVTPFTESAALEGNPHVMDRESRLVSVK